MTDEEIIKALECCITENGGDCNDCPLDNEYYEIGMGGCCNKLCKEAANLINRQKAEIERYKGVIKILEKDVRDAKAETIKSFRRG